MAELPECLRNVRSRIRSLFGFSPNPTENRKLRDEESGTDHELSLDGCAEGEIIEKKRSPSPSGTEKKQSNKKKTKGKSGFFNLKSTTSKAKATPSDDKKTSCALESPPTCFAIEKSASSHLTSQKHTEPTERRAQKSMGIGTKNGALRKLTVKASIATEAKGSEAAAVRLSQKHHKLSNDTAKQLNETKGHRAPSTLMQQDPSVSQITAAKEDYKSKESNFGTDKGDQEFDNTTHKSFKEITAQKNISAQGLGKITISSVYIKEINKIQFNRTIRDPSKLPADVKKENGGGDKQASARNSHKAPSSNLQNVTNGRNVGAKDPNSSSEDTLPKSDETTGPFDAKIPLPWEKIRKQSEGKVFVFTGNNTDQQNRSKPSTIHDNRRPKPAVSRGNSSDFSCQHPNITTKDTASQCDLDIYPCTCVIAENGRKVVCRLCVDQPVASSDKVLLSRNRDINSPTNQRSSNIRKESSSKETGRQPSTCSSITQTSLSSQKSQDTPTKCVTEDRKTKPKPGAPKKEQRRDNPEGPLKQGLGKAPVISQGGRSGRQGHDNTRQSETSNTPKLLREKQPDVGDKNTLVKIKTKGDAGAVSGKGAKMVAFVDNSKPTDNNQSKKLDKLKSIWKQIKGAKKKPCSDDCGNLLFELSDELKKTCISDPMAELFLAATAEDLDRIDGITREKSHSEKGDESASTNLDPPSTPLKQVAQPTEKEQSSEKKPRRVKTRRLPPKETEDAEANDKTITPSREKLSVKHDASPDKSFSGAELNSKSKIKRSQSLEELTSTSLRVQLPNPFVGEKVAFEYENPFEISGFIRIDDHYDPGEKAGRGHIPEIKVKQKRRGEPNKHLVTHQHLEEDCTNLNNYAFGDNMGGDPGLQILEDLEKCDEVAEKTAELSTEITTEEASAFVHETVDPSEVLPDMRHCQKIPLEVIYGKKGGGKDDEEEYQPRSAKKKKGRQRGRENRGRPPPLLGMKFDI